MNTETQIQTPPPPSLAMLAKTTVVAVVVAGVILITLVLPAEYAIDPLGTGRRLGLTEIASPKPAVVEVVKPAGGPMVPTQKGPIGEYPAEFKLDVAEIVLEPYEYVEYKYGLEKGATMLYSWQASAGVKHDFHGERGVDVTDNGPEEESFDKQDRQQSAGSYTAPFSGIHGWYWENPGGETIRIRLTTSGFYTSAVEIRSDRTRTPHTLRPLESLSAAPNASASTAKR
jgi:hypothetical protein